MHSQMFIKPSHLFTCSSFKVNPIHSSALIIKQILPHQILVLYYKWLLVLALRSGSYKKKDPLSDLPTSKIANLEVGTSNLEI